MARMFSGKRDVYLEIADRYANYICTGVLRDGDRLPSVRTAAGELGVNPNTVQRAYTYLEEQGLIQSLPKKGVFVCSASENQANHNQAAMDAVKMLKECGVGKSEILQALEEVYGND